MKQARRILVVDDNPDMLVSLSQALHLLGHECYVARDGYEAIVAALRIRPDVVLLDIALPGLDGFAVAQRLRQEPALRQIQIIAVTGHGNSEDRIRAMEAGIDQHVLKPVDPIFLESLFGGRS
jgi:CheY-like chemotaxis protein